MLQAEYNEAERMEVWKEGREKAFATGPDVELAGEALVPGYDLQIASDQNALTSAAALMDQFNDAFVELAK